MSKCVLCVSMLVFSSVIPRTIASHTTVSEEHSTYLELKIFEHKTDDVTVGCRQSDDNEGGKLGM